MSDFWKINWSGGKDSTAAVILHHQQEHTGRIVCFVPMLTDSIPLIMPDHYNFILSTASLFRSWGFAVDILHGITYYDHVHKIITRGKNKGLPMGIGLGLGFCQFRNYSKIRSALNSIDFAFDYEEISIASDEIERLPQLKSPKRSILYESGLTERDAFAVCLENDLLSPIYYGTSRRDGCAICPNAPPHELQKYVRAYPAAKDILLDIESFCKKYRPANPPYRNYCWFSDRLEDYPYQYELFGT